MSLQLRTSDGRTSFRPEEEIQIQVSWKLPHPPSSLEVRFVWHTSGKGDTDMDVAKTVEINNPGSSGEQKLAVILPRAPYSFSGKLISLLWGIELVSLPDEETSTRLDITIAPKGEEVVIGNPD